jgi:glyoxylase-like metal-dependent hydrolase (beta-lactamase superfamily II)
MGTQGKRGLLLALLAASLVAQESPKVTPLKVRALPVFDEGVVRTADANVRGFRAGEFPRLTKLAENVYVYESLQPIGALENVFSTNCFIVITNDGVLVADGLMTPALTKEMTAQIALLTRQPIRYVVVGADHGDHTGGNAAFPESAEFFASAYSKGVLERRQNAAARKIEYHEVQGEKTVLNLGGTEIQILNLGRAHTGGDLEVYLPKERILYMSEAYFNRLYPSTYSSYPSEWIGALKKAEAMSAALYIPAHGFIDSAVVLNQELITFRMCMEQIVGEARRLHDAKVPLDQAPRAAILGPYAYWTRAAQNLPDALKRVYMEADGQLK